MSLGMLAIWGLVLWGAFALLRGGLGASSPRKTPEEILRARFASGEIDEQEYRERLDVLSHERTRAPAG